MNKMIICKMLFLLLASFSLKAQALEVSTSKWEVVKEQLDKLEWGDLLVSDVMGVIYYPGDALISSGGKGMYKSFLDNIEKEEGFEKRKMLEGTVKRSFRPVAVSQELVDYMQNVIKRKIKFVILTSGKTGELGPIEDLAELRIGRLKQLGLNLRNMFDKNSFKIEGPKLKIGRPSVYKDGVIFASKNDKGESLEAFLKEVKFKPKKIVFIDNQMRKIDSVKKICEKHKIDFIGIHFTKIYDLTAEPVDKKIAEKQLSFLKNRMIWLSDKQAACMINQKDDYQFCKER